MSHYYTRDNHLLETKRRQFQCVVGTKEYTFLTDIGVFSKTGLDFGTRLLLETLLPVKKESLLDLGWGYGPIGIVLAKEWQVPVVMAEINLRAIELAKENAKLNHVEPSVFESDGFSRVAGKYHLVVTNPPIRAGKRVIYDWFTKAKEHLTEDGVFVFVIRKDQGAPSAIEFCRGQYKTVAVLARKSGYFIVKCQK